MGKKSVTRHAYCSDLDAAGCSSPPASRLLAHRGARPAPAGATASCGCLPVTDGPHPRSLLPLYLQTWAGTASSTFRWAESKLWAGWSPPKSPRPGRSCECRHCGLLAGRVLLACCPIEWWSATSGNGTVLFHCRFFQHQPWCLTTSPPTPPLDPLMHRDTVYEKCAGVGRLLLEVDDLSLNDPADVAALLVAVGAAALPVPQPWS